MQYLPLSLPFFSILVALFAVLLILLQLGILRYAYLSIGLSPGGAMLVLFGSLVGSYFNIPLAELPQQHIVARDVVHYFGMRYVVPVVINWPGTVIAANVCGAVIRVVVLAYLLIRYRSWLEAPPAVVCIAVLSYTGSSSARARHRGAGVCSSRRNSESPCVLPTAALRRSPAVPATSATRASAQASH